MAIFGLIQTVLEILLEFLKWQVAESQYRLKTALYGIEQDLQKKGDALNAKIDTASNAGDELVVEQLRNDYQAHALYAAGVKLVIPNDAGWDNVGVGAKVPGTATSERGPGDSAQPAESSNPSPTVKI
jgi:hypothetical protein